MVRTKEELLDKIRVRVGDDAGDDVLELIEDISDTYDDLNKRAGDSTDWEAKYNELDRSWRERYRDRFYGSASGDNEAHDDEKDEQMNEQTEPITHYEELFTEEV